MQNKGFRAYVCLIASNKVRGHPDKTGGIFEGAKPYNRQNTPMALTEVLCKNLKPKKKPYKEFDGQGLYLLIAPNGSKYWRYKYRFVGKETRWQYSYISVCYT
jgi:hypothetical protein